MSYALRTLWYERLRFLPGVLAVAFSAVLIALQCGLLLGLFSISSLPVDETRADVWVSHPNVPSVDLGRPIPADWESYLNLPGVERTEVYVQGFAYWSKPNGGSELCLVIGSRLGDDALGAVNKLTPELRARLSEPGAIVVDDSEYERLGIQKVGDTGEINGKRVRVVGTVTGYKSLAGPYIFCSLETARPLIRMNEYQATFLLAKCTSPQASQAVVEHLNAQFGRWKAEGADRDKQKLQAYTAAGFSFSSQWHWLTKTKAGIAMGCAAALGLLVGAVVTSQTLYAATLSQIREYAVLRALGIPRWRMALQVLEQSFWVGLVGVLLSLPASYGLAELATVLGAKVKLLPELMGGAVAICLLMAMVSGLAALRSLRQVDPEMLLR